MRTMTAAHHTLFLLASTLVVIVMAMVASSPAHAQQADVPLSDLSIASEYHDDDARVRWVLTVENAPLGLQQGTAFSLVRVRYVISDAVGGERTSVWTIRDLRPGESVENRINSLTPLRAEPTAVPEKIAQRFYAEIIEADPVEAPGFQFNNATEHWALINRRTAADRFTAADAAVSVASISDRFPQPERGTTFNIRASNPADHVALGRPGLRTDSTLFDVRVEIGFSPGLAFAANQQPPSGTIFDPATGIWDVGALDKDVEIELPVAVHLTADSLEALPLEKRCLTAKVIRAEPWFAYDPLKRENDTVTVCLGERKALFSSGTMDLVSFYPCISDTSTPCASVDTLELVAKRSDHSDYLQPESFTVQVHDPDGRTGTGSPIWSTANAMNLRLNMTRLTSSWEVAEAVTVTAPGGGDAPGQWAIVSGGFDILRATDSSKVGYGAYSLGDFGNNPQDYAYDFDIEFSALGSYKVLHEISGRLSGTTYTDTGTYTFHVGPIAELEVLWARQTPDGLEIGSVNNGPDQSLGARAVLSNGGQSCEFDVVGLSAGRACVIPDVELTGAQIAGTEPIGYIENHVDYTVCIDSDGDDVLPKPSSKSACEGPADSPTGNSWHSGNVYDHIGNNNDIYLSQDPPPTLNLQRARARAVPMLVVRWTRQEDLLGSPVSYYQVERLDAAGWKPLGNVPQPEDPREDPEYQDGDEDRAPTPRYRVRAVNEEGVAGPWAEAGGVAQPGVVLTVDPGTIKEPDADSLGATTKATVTATLTGQVSSQDITVVVSAAPASGPNPAEEGDFTLSENRTLTIPAGSRESTGVVTVTAVTETGDDYDSHDEQVRITAAASHARCTGCSLTLTIDDADDPGLTLNKSTLTVMEDDPAGGTYTVKLDAQPSEDVTVTPSSNNADVTVDPASLTFTADNWDTTQTFTVRAREDPDAADDKASISHQFSGAAEYRNIRAGAVSVTVDDVDIPGVTVEAGDNLTVMEDGRTSVQYVVKLDTEPSGSVHITVTGSANDAVSISPASFTLTRTNWERGQTVTVQARADQDADYETVSITHAIDDARTSANEYDGVSIAGVTVSVTDAQAPADYDLDDDGLLDISTQEQLNALRWDLDGNGVADDEANAAKYAAAFPRMMADSCSADFVGGTSVEGAPGPCIGYELTKDITLSGNWTPIGGNQHFDDFETPLEEYKATFDGDGFVISKLSINRRDGKNIGLFGAISGSKAIIRNVGVEDVNVLGRDAVGALVGRNHGGTIERAWSTGRVSGNTFTGGLVGWSMNGDIKQSYSEANVTGWNASDSGGPLWSTRMGGLVGGNHGMIANSYAMGEVRGRGHVAGLAGENGGGATIRNSYATGAVSTEDEWPFKAGLVGWQQNGNENAVVNSYWDTETTGQAEGVVQGNKLDDAKYGKTKSEMQAPESNTGIYANWDASVWNFRTKSEYPCLIGVGSCPAITPP